MSAYVVSQEHITALLQAATPRYAGDGKSYYWNGEHHYFGGHSQRIGQVLLDENYRSVNHRYDESEPTPTFQLCNVRNFSPVEWIKLLNSYSYQACECDDWNQTEAHAIIQALESFAIRQLPGYDDAPWSL